MLRIILGSIAGFVSWLVLWIAAEILLSAVSPDRFGRHQAAFQAAIENGTAFEADAAVLAIHCVLATFVSAAAGFLAATAADESKRVPLGSGLLVLALGFLKAVMSWQYVPLWYHMIFTAILLPAVLAGGRLKHTA